MIDRLRLFWQQPLKDAARRRLFLIAAALVVGVAALALVVQRSPLAPDEPRRTPDGGQPHVGGALPLSTAIGAPAAPSEESRPYPTDAVRPAGIRAARRAARRFLRGYLPYSYGREDARSITNARQRFRKQLAKEPPRVPRRERHRRARVSLVQTNVVDERHASLSALVTDGARSYTLELRLGRRGPRWQVDGVTG